MANIWADTLEWRKKRNYKSKRNKRTFERFNRMLLRASFDGMRASRKRKLIETLKSQVCVTWIQKWNKKKKQNMKLYIRAPFRARFMDTNVSTLTTIRGRPHRPHIHSHRFHFSSRSRMSNGKWKSVKILLPTNFWCPFDHIFFFLLLLFFVSGTCKSIAQNVITCDFFFRILYAFAMQGRRCLVRQCPSQFSTVRCSPLPP